MLGVLGNIIGPSIMYIDFFGDESLCQFRMSPCRPGVGPACHEGLVFLVGRSVGLIYVIKTNTFVPCRPVVGPLSARCPAPQPFSAL